MLALQFYAGRNLITFHSAWTVLCRIYDRFHRYHSCRSRCLHPVRMRDHLNVHLGKDPYQGRTRPNIPGCMDFPKPRTFFLLEILPVHQLAFFFGCTLSVFPCASSMLLVIAHPDIRHPTRSSANKTPDSSDASPTVHRLLVPAPPPDDKPSASAYSKSK